MQQTDKDMFKFPKSLPNDLEGFVVFYPKKFPNIIQVYEELAKKYFKKPKEFKKFIYAQQKELYAGFYKIKKDYDAEKNKTDEFLVSIDQRLHKLFCFRFWIVNYGFADGPMHDYYVEKIRYYSEMISEWNNIEKKEESVLDVERTLLQGDYADLYLQIAFLGLDIYDFLISSKFFKKEVEQLKKLIEEGKTEECYKLIDDLLKFIQDDKNKNNNEVKKLCELLKFPIYNARVRGDNLSVYNALIHAFEFHDKSVELKKRYGNIKKKIKSIFKSAQKKLNKEQLKELTDCYTMSNLFKEAKDVYGDIDSQLIPFWFDLLYELAARYKISNPVLGHSGMFYSLVWYLPDKLKAKVFTQDYSDFSLEKL